VAPEAHAHFCGLPQEVRDARNFVEATLDLWDCDDPDQVAALLTSEVTALAVRQMASEFTVRLDLSGDLLRVDIVDTSPARTEEAMAQAEDSGLFLLASLAREWGTKTVDSGTITWFKMPVLPRQPPPD
jgi:serine/threonine-protein kinase RsbW